MNTKSPKKSNTKIHNENEVGFQKHSIGKKTTDLLVGKRLKTEDSALKYQEGAFEITKEHQKIVFKGIIDLDKDVKKKNQNFSKVDELWDWVNNNENSNQIHSKEFLIKIVEELDEKSKIVYNEEDRTIYLL